jgi:glycine/serine hydroxymethyltransferase
VEYVNIDGISGLNLMTMVSLSFLSINQGVYILPSSKGGHHVTKKMLETLGYKVYEIPFDREGNIDQDIMLEDIKKYNISMVYIDQMMGNRLYDFSDLKQKLTKDCIIYYDISHNMAYFFQSDIKTPLEF